MKKFFHLILLIGMLSAINSHATEIKIEFSELGLQGTDLTSMSPITLNEDIHLVFEKGSAATVPSFKASNGRVTLTMGAVIKIIGSSDDVNITSISLTSPKASNTFSAGAAECLPAGTFTIDKTTYTSTWSSNDGSNSVQITNTMGAPVFTSIAVTYTGGNGSSTGPGEDPEDPEPTVSTDNMLSASFDTADDFAKFTKINVEASTYTWSYDKSAQAAYIRNEFGSTASLPKDDYLVSPALALKAGVYYQLCFTAWNGSAGYPERIGACIGKQPTADALNDFIIADTELEGAGRTKFNTTFTVEADGDYYAALHAASAPGMFTLFADDFTVSRGVLPTGPAEVTDFAATPDKSGALNVTLSLTAPATDMAGSQLSNLKNVKLSRDGVELTVIECKPGEKITYIDNVEAEGSYRYTAAVEGEHGCGFDAVADAWVGIAAPVSPSELTVTETAPGVLKFTWSAVTTNIHGHEIAPETVTYSLTAGGSANVIATGLSGTEAVVNYPAEGQPQTITDFTIKAHTAAGASTGGASTPIVVVGQPYTMPYIENFPGGMLTTGQTAQIIADENHAPGCWGYFEQLVNDDILPVKPDGGMAAFFPYADGDRSVWRSAKIEIGANAVNPYLSFFYYTLPGATDHMAVDVNGETVSEFTIDDETRGWREVLIPLADYKGTVVRIGLTGYCVDANNKICIDNIAVKDEPANDMAITRARIPQEMQQGRQHLCSVKVTNLGVQPSGNYTLTVTDGDNEVWSTEGSGLERGAELEYTFNICHEAFDREGTTYTVTLTTAGDENTDDNVKSTETTFSACELPAPTGIAATATTDGYEITWAEATTDNMPVRQITEGFEAYDEFVCDTAGEWSFIDGDGCGVLGIRDGYHSYPNMFSPMAFIVFNNHDGSFPCIGTTSFDPYEGGQCLMSASVDVINSADRANDDRLISPRLSGKAQTISFYARSSGMVFPEDVSVMISSTDRLATSFTKVETFKAIRNEWKRYEVELPEGTQYFAICNESYDQYMLFVDNISFEAAPLETTVTGYDVYAGDPDSNEWIKLNDSPVDGTKLTVTELDGDKSLRVAARFANGCTSYSAPATVDLSGIDNVTIDSENGATEYFDLRGVRLDDRPTAAGLYIMRNGTTVQKIVIK